MKQGEKVDESDDHEIEERDVTAEQQHCHDHDDGGIGQFLIAADSLVLRFPWPRSFLELGANFAEKVFRFRDHWVGVEAIKRCSDGAAGRLENFTM